MAHKKTEKNPFGAGAPKKYGEELEWTRFGIPESLMVRLDKEAAKLEMSRNELVVGLLQGALPAEEPAAPLSTSRPANTGGWG